MKVLIVHCSMEGQTRKIAQRMLGHVSELGGVAETIDVRDELTSGYLEGISGTIVGASIHAGSHARSAREFVLRHHGLLERFPSAFFSVSLSAASRNRSERQLAWFLAREFLRETDWHPRKVAVFGGALRYSRYGFFKRRIMRCIAMNEGGGSDFSQDYEYTDWPAVGRFVREFCESVGPAISWDDCVGSVLETEPAGSPGALTERLFPEMPVEHPGASGASRF